jgi:hypothetical protein
MELIQQYERDFETLKKELKFKSTMQEVEDIFFVKDLILEKGYVSPNLARQISHRINDLFSGWIGYIHGLIVPNPGSMINMNEAGLFDEAEKAKLVDLMNSLMAFSTSNGPLGITKDKKLQAEFIDNGVALWNKHKQEFLDIAQRINGEWARRASKPTKPQKPESHYG